MSGLRETILFLCKDKKSFITPTEGSVHIKKTPIQNIKIQNLQENYDNKAKKSINFTKDIYRGSYYLRGNTCIILVTLLILFTIYICFFSKIPI